LIFRYPKEIFKEEVSSQSLTEPIAKTPRFCELEEVMLGRYQEEAHALLQPDPIIYSTGMIHKWELLQRDD
jgi:hypothetical protein